MPLILPDDHGGWYLRGSHRVGLGDVEVVVDDVVEGWHELFLDDDRCFLCGTRLTRTNRSAEHVVPKWLQRRHNLWNQQLELLDGSFLPYRQATVPACRSCNGGVLHDLEDDLAPAFAAGRDAIDALPAERLWLWLLKLSYGLLRIEHRVPQNRADRSGPTILDAAGTAAGALLHLYLQSVLGLTVIDSTLPLASIFTFQVQQHAEAERNFDLIDLLLPGPLIAVLAGGVGIVAVTTDLGAAEYHGVPGLDELRDFPLHPTQFHEIVGRVMFATHLLDEGPVLMVSQEGPRNRRVQIDHDWRRVPPRLRQPPPELPHLARMIARARRVPVEDVAHGDDGFWSVLFNDDGEPIKLPLDREP